MSAAAMPHRQNAPLPNGELVGVAQDPFVGITLQNAIMMALQHNTDLALAESNNRIANFQIVAANGAYDVNFRSAAVIYAFRLARAVAVRDRTRRRTDHADLRRHHGRLHR